MKRLNLFSLMMVFAAVAIPYERTEASIGLTLSRCPWGAVLQGGKPPDRFEEWCEKINKNNQPVRHGIYKAWFETGEIEMVGKYWWGKPTETWYFWHKNGQLRSEVLYRWGKKEGEQRTFYGNGNLESKMSFRENLPEGQWEFYYESGKKRLEIDHVSWAEKTLLAYDRDGNKRASGRMKNNVAHGPWVFWFFNGIMMSRGDIENGQPRGVWPTWASSGSRTEDCSFHSATLDVVMKRPNCAMVLSELQEYSAPLEILNAPPSPGFVSD